MTQYFSPHVAITNTINYLYKRVFKCADRIPIMQPAQPP